MTPRLRLLLVSAVAVHVWLVASILSQPLYSDRSVDSRRFATARLYFDAVTWPGPGGDFFALYHAGIQARRGLSPFADEEPRITPYYFRYIYSPLLANTLGRLVTNWPPRIAYLLWGMVIEIALVVSILVFCRTAIETRFKIVGVSLLLTSQPYFLELHMGQFTFVAAAMTLVAAVAVRDRSRGAAMSAPVLVAVAGVLKTFPFVSLPAFLKVRMGWGVVAVTVLCAAALQAWPSIQFPGASRHFAAMTLVDDTGGPHPGAFSLLQAFFVIAQAMSGNWLPSVYPMLPASIALIALAGATIVVLRAHRDDTVAGASLMLLVFFLSFLHVWEHHYSAVILTGVFLLGVAADRSNPGGEAAAWVSVAALAVLAAPSPFVFLARDPKAWTTGSLVLLSLSKAVPTAVMLIIAARYLRGTRVQATHSKAAAAK